VDVNGTPIQGATVTINGNTYTTGANGQITATNLPNGTYTYTVTAPGFNANSGSVTGAGVNQTASITLTALPRFDITFIVKDQDGVAITGATVVVSGVSYTTDANGQVVVPNVLSGTYSFTVVKVGYIGTSNSAVVANADLTVNVTLTQIVHDVTFTITDPEGNPIPNGTVVIDGTTYTTDNEGVVVVALPDGTYPYTVTAPGYEGTTGTTTVNGAPVPVAVTLQPDLHDVTITVLDHTGEPLPGAEVVIDGETYTTDENGQIVVALMDGTYTYTVTAEGYDAQSGNVTVAGSDLPVEVQMELSSVVIEASNVMTPNGDGYNDTWNVNNLPAVKGYTLYILNNIGEILYESENYDNSWDATYNGTPLDGGTYYYIFQKDASIINGFITIVR